MRGRGRGRGRGRRQFSHQNRSEPGLYRVKNVIDFRRGARGDEYLVWWKGYKKEEATWEPEENIQTEGEDEWD